MPGNKWKFIINSLRLSHLRFLDLTQECPGTSSITLPHLSSHLNLSVSCNSEQKIFHLKTFTRKIFEPDVFSLRSHLQHSHLNSTSSFYWKFRTPSMLQAHYLNLALAKSLSTTKPWPFHSTPSLVRGPFSPKTFHLFFSHPLSVSKPTTTK